MAVSKERTRTQVHTSAHAERLWYVAVLFLSLYLSLFPFGVVLAVY
jgi:hypothetical protein